MSRAFARVFFVIAAIMVAVSLTLSSSSTFAQTAKVHVQPDPLSLCPASIQELTGTMISTGEVIAWGNRLKSPSFFRVVGSVVDIISPDGIYQVWPILSETTVSPAPAASALDHQVFELQERVDAMVLGLLRQGKSSEDVLDFMASEFKKSGLVNNVCIRDNLLCYTTLVNGRQVASHAPIPDPNPPVPNVVSEDQAILAAVGPLMGTLRNGGKVIIGDYPPIQVPPQLFNAFEEDLRNAQAIAGGAPSQVISGKVAKDILHPSLIARKER